MTQTTNKPAKRDPSAIDQIAERHTRALAALDPLTATAVGIPGHDHLMPALDPAWHAQMASLNRATLAELDQADPRDEVDRITLAAMRERLGLDLEMYEAAETLADLNNLASPLQMLRDIFDLMPTDTDEEWEVIAQRLAGLPAAVDGYIASLREGAKRGRVSAIRQVKEGIRQARELAEPGSFFDTFTADHPAAAAQAAAARAAYGRLADFLETELAPQAPLGDAVGRERYVRFSRLFLGATVDLDETYEWGLAELARIVAEQTKVAEEIAGPGATVAEAAAKLKADEKYLLHGTEALQGWMQAKSDQAIAELDGTHFDIPEAIKNLECRIAPTHSGMIYYTPPSDDLSRPGRMWWSVPPGIDEFSTWRETTTVYHEGVPGHHLQCGIAILNKDELNSWRRVMCWSSGHGEGWALYAEKLMAELGFLSDAPERLGWLDGQRMRAARVVFDIGVHLNKPVPIEWGGDAEGTIGWADDDGTRAWDFLRANINENEKFIHFEFLRYLGYPGQAPSYKIGERLWEQARADSALPPRQFHDRALKLGSLPLDVLLEALAETGIDPVPNES